MRVLVFFLVLIFSGCASWIPAAVNEIKPGVFEISTTGNSFASSEKMRKKLEDKASSLCGEKGFEITKQPSIEWKEQKDYSTGIKTSYQTMQMTVECN